jgi:hypothetical protein
LKWDIYITMTGSAMTVRVGRENIRVKKKVEEIMA